MQAIGLARASDRQLSYLNELLTQAPEEFQRYQIAPGDILGRIVRDKYGVPFHQLWPIISALNPQIRDPDEIVAGRHILLPEI